MKILLAVDGSPAALAAVQHALRWAREGLAVEFVLATVQEPPSLYEVVVAHDPAVLDAVRTEAGTDMLAEASALLDAAGHSFESEVAGGEPGHVLVDLIERYGCDAVVAGATGASEGKGASARAIGTVAMALLRHSPVPVTLVRLPEADA